MFRYVCLLKYLIFIIFLLTLGGCKGGGKERIVFLSGGNAWELFESYIKKLEEEKQPYKLGNIKVKIWDGKNFKEYSIKWTDYLSGDPPKKIWQRKLINVEAKFDSKALELAKSYGWEIMSIQASSEEKKEKEVGEKKEISTAKSFCTPEAESHINLGLQFIQSKQIDNAIKEFKYAISISPNCGVAYGNLIQAYLLEKNYNFAIDTYKTGIQKAGDDNFLHISGAIAYTATKDYDYALVALEEALKNGFKDKNILTSKDLGPLRKEKKKDFCNILEKYKIIIKECL